MKITRGILLLGCMFFILLFNSCCKNCDEVVEEEGMFPIKQIYDLYVIPFQIIKLDIDGLSGSQMDYNLFIGEDLIEISNLTSNYIEFEIPLDINLGKKSLRLVYKNKEYYLGELEVISPDQVFTENIAYLETKDLGHPYILIDSSNNIITPYIKNDILKSVSVQSIDGKMTHIELNENNLPTQLYNDSITILINGYDFDNNTVNVAYYFNDDPENVKYEYSIFIDGQILYSAINGPNSKGKHLKDRKSQLLKAIGVGISGATCIIGSLTAVTGIGLFIGITGCATFLYDITTLLDPSKENTVITYMGGFWSNKMNTIGCLRKDVFSCIELVLQASQGILTVYDEYSERNKLKLEEYINTINLKYWEYWNTKITGNWVQTWYYNGNVLYGQVDHFVLNADGKGYVDYISSDSNGNDGEIIVVDNYFGPEYDLYWYVSYTGDGNYRMVINSELLYYQPNFGTFTPDNLSFEVYMGTFRTIVSKG